MSGVSVSDNCIATSSVSGTTRDDTGEPFEDFNCLGNWAWVISHITRLGLFLTTISHEPKLCICVENNLNYFKYITLVIKKCRIREKSSREDRKLRYVDKHALLLGNLKLGPFLCFSLFISQYLAFTLSLTLKIISCSPSYPHYLQYSEWKKESNRI